MSEIELLETLCELMRSAHLALWLIAGLQTIRAFLDGIKP